jgi:hypothetical protein
LACPDDYQYHRPHKKGETMVWTYKQSTGQFFKNGALAQINRGYSGKSVHKNRPASQAVPNQGPIPRGAWVIGGYTSSKGPLTITLTPKPETNTFGRTNFRIHGDSITNPGNASEGCIVLEFRTRQNIACSSDLDLEVIQ